MGNNFVIPMRTQLNMEMIVLFKNTFYEFPSDSLETLTCHSAYNKA